MIMESIIVSYNTEQSDQEDVYVWSAAKVCRFLAFDFQEDKDQLLDFNGKLNLLS